MITSKITSKAQTTVPQAVRSALGVSEGDQLAYHIDGDRVVLTKVSLPVSSEDPFGAFSEWNSEADRLGYADF